MAPTRIARPGRAGVVLLAALLAGCSQPPRPAPTAAAADPAPPGTPTATDPGAFARLFLKAVSDGTATPAMLTPEFKKVIAEPVFPSDQAQGYSDDAAEQWLKRFRQHGFPSYSGPVGRVTGGGDAYHFYIMPVSVPDSSVDIRVCRTGGGWAVDWFWTEYHGRELLDREAGTVVPGGDPLVWFAVKVFSRALARRDERLAEGLMTQRFKAALAPPFASDKRGYNRGTLARKLAEYPGEFRPLKVEGGVVTGQLVWFTPKAKFERKPSTLKLVKGDRPWDWLVDEFKAE